MSNIVDSITRAALASIEADDDLTRYRCELCGSISEIDEYTLRPEIFMRDSELIGASIGCPDCGGFFEIPTDWVEARATLKRFVQIVEDE